MNRWGQYLPGLVYQATAEEIARGEIRCRPVLRDDERAPAWPLSQRLVR
jgi:hypothetical protein